jgi:hypothetical protein
MLRSAAQAFVGVGGYVGGFALHSHKVGGIALGKESLPHPAFWTEVRSLVEDGVSFAKARVQEARGGSGGAPATRGQAGGEGGESEAVGLLKKGGAAGGYGAAEAAPARGSSAPADSAVAEGTGGGACSGERSHTPPCFIRAFCKTSCVA